MFEIISGNEYCSAAGSYWERYSTRETSCVAALLPSALIHPIAALLRFRGSSLRSRISGFGYRFQGPHDSCYFYSPNFRGPSQRKFAFSSEDELPNHNGWVLLQGRGHPNDKSEPRKPSQPTRHRVPPQTVMV